MGELRRKRVTISQVAARAEVSVGTVSNYLNGTADVSEEKAVRIQKAIDELEFTPDLFARSLRKKNSKTIYILTPNLENTFYTNIISEFMRHSSTAGYNIHILAYEYSAEMEKRLLRSLESSKVGTIVVIFNGIDDREQICRLVKKGMHVILADRQNEIDGTSLVGYDNSSVFQEMISLMKAQNYRKVGYLTEPLIFENIKKRCESFRAACEKAAYDAAACKVYSDPSLSLNKLQNGYLFMKKLLESHSREELPDCWSISSDYLAIGVMRAIRESGYRIPEDFGVIGFDNVDFCGFVSPGLTTVEQNCSGFAEELWQTAENIINTGVHERRRIPQTMIRRQSC